MGISPIILLKILVAVLGGKLICLVSVASSQDNKLNAEETRLFKERLLRSNFLLTNSIVHQVSLLENIMTVKVTLTLE
jgi:hypothetical protein